MLLVYDQSRLKPKIRLSFRLLLASHMFYVISAGCLGFASIDHVINLSVSVAQLRDSTRRILIN